MNYFKPIEFREWYDLMSPRLLTMADVYRHLMDQAIEISAHPDSLGRRLGIHSKSAHNVDYWGECLAIDCFIKGVTTQDDARQAFQLAKRIGFTGIGVYPGWTNNYGVNQVGFHLDVRPTAKMGSPSTWGRVGGKMVDIYTAISLISDS